jgi:hypothetical protein
MHAKRVMIVSLPGIIIIHFEGVWIFVHRMLNFATVAKMAPTQLSFEAV